MGYVIHRRSSVIKRSSGGCGCCCLPDLSGKAGRVPGSGASVEPGEGVWNKNPQRKRHTITEGQVGMQSQTDRFRYCLDHSLSPGVQDEFFK